MSDTRKELWCCACGGLVQARLTSGAEVYPHRPDLADIPRWRSDQCGNHVGTHYKTTDRTRPLGNIPSPEIKNARIKIHELIDPAWRSGRISRGKLYQLISSKNRPRIPYGGDQNDRRGARDLSGRAEYPAGDRGMTDALIEKVARALHAKEWEKVRAAIRCGFDDDEPTKEYWLDSARAALAAIEETHIIVARPRPDSLTQADVDRASEKIFERAVELVEGTGTHAVVPVVPTEEMFDAMFGSAPMGKHHPARLACYKDMLSARPKVTP